MVSSNKSLESIVSLTTARMNKLKSSLKFLYNFPFPAIGSTGFTLPCLNSSSILFIIIAHSEFINSGL